ncbi:hypothetical protein PvtlMGM2_2189, partial [Prevotella sp. MGM2]
HFSSRILTNAPEFRLDPEIPRIGIQIPSIRVKISTQTFPNPILITYILTLQNVMES